ncbi:hypothetical protein [Oceanobacillus damuensis]|nr:hypothetical protein [Oceanobacillus damuensis]
METKQMIRLASNQINDGGYKVIEVNMSDSSGNLYAVCTPIKK